MAEDALDRAVGRGSPTGGDATTRPKGILWLSVAYVLAGAAASALGALASGAAPWLGVLVACVVSALVLFGFDAYHRTTRFVELLWSLGPVAIAVAIFRFAPHEGASGVRRALVLGVVLVWGLRIAVTWVMRFRGLGPESSLDGHLRSRYGANFWAVSLGALHVAPSIVLFLGNLSLLAIFSEGRSGLNIVDIAASGATLAGLVIEAVADLQLARFLRTNRIPTRVCEDGLWSLCRHPRLLGEMLFWWGIALFALSAHATGWWVVFGPLALSLVLVLYAAPRRDRRELERRPDYASYMKRVPAFLPKVLRS